MTPRIVSQVGLVFVVSAIVVLVFSIWRSSHGSSSAGLSSLGTILLVIGLALRVRARRVGA